MRALKLTIAAVLLAFAPVAASADGAHSQTKATAMVGEIHVSDGWVRAHLPNRPTAGYLSLKNTGDAADRLIDAFCNHALYETVIRARSGGKAF